MKNLLIISTLIFLLVFTVGAVAASWHTVPAGKALTHIFSASKGEKIEAKAISYEEKLTFSIYDENDNLLGNDNFSCGSFTGYDYSCTAIVTFTAPGVKFKVKVSNTTTNDETYELKVRTLK